MKKMLMDSGPLIALFDRSDKYHLASVEFIKQNQAILITTLASITEVLHLLKFSREAQQAFLAWIHAGAVTIETINVYDLERIKTLMLKYTDLPMDFADACLVFLAEKFNINEVATIDRDFDIYRLKGNQPFTLFIK